MSAASSSVASHALTSGVPRIRSMMTRARAISPQCRCTAAACASARRVLWLVADRHEQRDGLLEGLQRLRPLACRAQRVALVDQVVALAAAVAEAQMDLGGGSRMRQRSRRVILRNAAGRQELKRSSLVLRNPDVPGGANRRFGMSLGLWPIAELQGQVTAVREHRALQATRIPIEACHRRGLAKLVFGLRVVAGGFRNLCSHHQQLRLVLRGRAPRPHEAQFDMTACRVELAACAVHPRQFAQRQSGGVGVTGAFGELPRFAGEYQRSGVVAQAVGQQGPIHSEGRAQSVVIQLFGDHLALGQCGLLRVAVPQAVCAICRLLQQLPRVVGHR